MVEGVAYCQSPCSIDQLWNSTRAQCQAVNCLQKYLGAKSWYNKSSGRCEPAVVCIEGLYDAINNVCVNNNEIPTAPFGIDPNATFPPSNAAPTALNCGPHGAPVGDVCQCNDGWTTPQSGPQVRKENIAWCSEFAQTQLVNVQGEDEVNPLVVVSAGLARDTQLTLADLGVRPRLLVPRRLRQLLRLLRQEVLLLLQALPQSAQQAEALRARQQTAQVEGEAAAEEQPRARHRPREVTRVRSDCT